MQFLTNQCTYMPGIHDQIGLINELPSVRMAAHHLESNILKNQST